MPHALTPHTIDDEAQLRALVGEPAAVTRSKIATRLNRLTRQWVERAPLVMLATSDAQGRCDVSPRGDPAGFVRVLDERTLLLPERPGNRIADSLRNVLANPHLALLFVVPGVSDTFRVDGRATITTDAALLAPCAVEGKVPALGLLVDVESCYTHCSKAFIRSDFWNPARHEDPATMPRGGAVLREVRGDDFDDAAYDAARAERYARREGFY